MTKAAINPERMTTKQAADFLGLAEKYYFENGGRERLLDEAGVADEDIEQTVISFS